jgi:hypothetical protein
LCQQKKVKYKTKKQHKTRKWQLQMPAKNRNIFTFKPINNSAFCLFFNFTCTISNHKQCNLAMLLSLHVSQQFNQLKAPRKNHVAYIHCLF